ncbi:hypothetical protein DFJ74DRAFT_600963 [Hyaloraphidium curvatum]|nr:hypothetical protein DFJ74DRAFT_600963 [Hyaloraphidium curvatum]
MPLPASPPRPARTYATPYVIAPPGRPPRITGLAYDARMLAHRILDEEHDTHPENPERLRKVWETLRREGLADRCSRVKCRNATLDELRLFHTEEMIAHIVRTTEMSSYELRNFGNAFNSLYVNHESYASAMLSCGSVIEMCSRVARGELHNGVCVVRPPGHHAEAHEPMGFCVFNNVAVAANVLKAKHGLRRILILDWDVHHGNGTQNAFFNDPAVLYISIHRYDNMQFYPNSNDAAANAIGEGPGTGFNVNVPWEGGGGLGDADYIHAFQRVVMPIATEYNPELVIISAGFDAAMDDPLGGCRVTPFGYAHMTYMLSSLAGGRVVVALEGGYNARSVSLSMAAVTSVLLGDPVPSFDYGRVGVPCRKAYEVVEQVVRIQSRYWESMLPRHHMRVDRNKRDRTVYKAAAWSMQGWFSRPSATQSLILIRFLRSLQKFFRSTGTCSSRRPSASSTSAGTSPRSRRTSGTASTATSTSLATSPRSPARAGSAGNSRVRAGTPSSSCTSRPRCAPSWTRTRTCWSGGLRTCWTRP